MDIKKLKAFLAEYLPAMAEKIPTIINRGGCGFFAYHLSSVLTEMNVPHKIVAMWQDDVEDYDNMKLYLDGKRDEKEHEGIGHAVVEVDGMYFDGFGNAQHELSEYSDKMEISEEKLFPLLSNKGNWNQQFDVKQNGKIIKYLKDIPSKFAEWKEGQYKHTMSEEDEKYFNHTLNSHSKNWMERQRFGFWF